MSNEWACPIPKCNYRGETKGSVRGHVTGTSDDEHVWSEVKNDVEAPEADGGDPDDSGDKAGDTESAESPDGDPDDPPEEDADADPSESTDSDPDNPDDDPEMVSNDEYQQQQAQLAGADTGDDTDSGGADSTPDPDPDPDPDTSGATPSVGLLGEIPTVYLVVAAVVVVVVAYLLLSGGSDDDVDLDVSEEDDQPNEMPPGGLTS